MNNNFLAETAEKIRKCLDNKENLQKVLQEVQESGNNINSIKIGNFFPPLHLARSAEIVELLVAFGADVDGPNVLGQPPLFSAASLGNIDVIKTLVRLKANVNAPDEDGQTPLFAASTEEKLDAIKTLVRLGANIDALLPGLDFTPLMFAAMGNHAKSVRTLLSLGAKKDNINLRQLKKHPEVQSILVSAGVNLGIELIDQLNSYQDLLELNVEIVDNIETTQKEGKVIKVARKDIAHCPNVTSEDILSGIQERVGESMLSKLEKKSKTEGYLSSLVIQTVVPALKDIATRADKSVPRTLLELLEERIVIEASGLFLREVIADLLDLSVPNLDPSYNRIEFRNLPRDKPSPQIVKRTGLADAIGNALKGITEGYFSGTKLIQVNIGERTKEELINTIDDAVPGFKDRHSKWLPQKIGEGVYNVDLLAEDLPKLTEKYKLKHVAQTASISM